MNPRGESSIRLTLPVARERGMQAVICQIMRLIPSLRAAY